MGLRVQKMRKLLAFCTVACWQKIVTDIASGNPLLMGVSAEDKRSYGQNEAIERISDL